METTTIQVSNDLKKKLSSFGTKGESYEEILRRVYNMAVKTQLREFLMEGGDFVSLEEARKEVEKKWPKSRLK